MVGQEHQCLAGLRVFAQPLWITALGVAHGQLDLLVADQPDGAIHREGVKPPAFEIRFGAGDKEAPTECRVYSRSKSRQPRSIT